MWDYESDAPFMWPEQQKYPSAEETRAILERNPEEAAIRGKWGDPEFLNNVSSLNPKLKDTQFADYHGHGWNFRAVFKRDRKGTLLDKDGKAVADDDPAKFGKAVQLSSIHMDLGMHCVDCHFGQDAHGNGHVYGEVAAAIEITCADCHGTVSRYPTLFTTGPASQPGGTDLSLLRTQDGRKRFEWRDGRLYQRAALDPGKEWEMTLVRDTVDPASPKYNAKAARAKLMVERRVDAVGPGRGCGQARARRRQDDLPGLPRLVDDELRRLPPADPGEREVGAPALRGRRDAQLRDLQSAGRARRHVPARHPRRRSRAARSRRCAPARRWCCRRPTSTASASTSSSRRSRRRGSARRRSRRTIRTPSARPRPRPAPIATCRRRTTTTRSWRSCCCRERISSISSATTRGSARRSASPPCRSPNGTSRRR